MAKILTEYTYHKSKSNLSYCYYNGGWSKWSSTKLNGGYAGDGTNYKYCVAIKFTTPDFVGLSEDFVITIPYCRSANTDTQAADGTLKLKLTTTDPRTGSLSAALADCNVTAEWSARNSSGSKDKKMHKVNVTFTNELEPSTTYYIVIGTVDIKSNNDWIEIGEYTDEDKLWLGTLTTYCTEGTSPTLTITDKGNNTAVMSGVLGKAGTSNNIKSATLYYTTDGSDPREPDSARTTVSLTASSGAVYSEVTPAITKDCTVTAYVVCVFEYNSTSATKSLAVKFYAAPTAPGKPKLLDSSFKNGRLTIKQNWGYSWAPAKAANTNSPVEGYNIILSKITDSITNNFMITDTDTTFFFSPTYAKYDFKPGDKVRLGVRSYTKNGAGNTLSSSYVYSDTTTVQNAGVVNVKVAGEWVEGQVYVRVNNEWKEAETVNVKVGSWQESQ